MEKYLSLRLKTGEISFVITDSLQFLNASLDSLSASCPEFKYTETLCSTHIRKGVFPYSYLDSVDKLSECQLPPRSDFYNTLTNSECSVQEYERAQLAWREFGCQNLQDYMMAYLKLDVYLLSDIFEAFRKISLVEDGLDAVNFVGIPGLSWSSCLKMTKVKLDLLSEKDQYEFFERGIRGGMTFVNDHHVCRNVPGEEGYDSCLPRTELLYVDANNLYGSALSSKLPMRDFQWVNNPESILDNLLSMDCLNMETGYVLEIDLHIPKEIHDLVDDLPLAAETKCPSSITPYMNQLWQDVENGKSYRPGKKLLLTHEDKFNYVIHFALLQFFLKMGAIVRKVHRAISFHQSAFFEPYITFNSMQRANASEQFRKDYYKLKNNSLYGKCIENVRKRKDIRICNTPEKLMTYASKPLFLRSAYFAEDLVGVQLLKTKIVLDKPIYIGQVLYFYFF